MNNTWSNNWSDHRTELLHLLKFSQHNSLIQETHKDRLNRIFPFQKEFPHVQLKEGISFTDLPEK
jgi:hypothetical protein